MEARLQTKLDESFRHTKEVIRDWLVDNNASIKNRDNDDLTETFLSFIFDMNTLELQQEDFHRRRRSRNVIAPDLRCLAKRANGDQCTRRKLNDQFCGTHMKGTPHGIVDEDTNSIQPATLKIEIMTELINGIHWYIDDNGNVYSHEDIINCVPSPRVIGVKTDSGEINFAK